MLPVLAAGTAIVKALATVSQVEDSTDKTTVREDMAATSKDLATSRLSRVLALSAGNVVNLGFIPPGGG